MDYSNRPLTAREAAYLFIVLVAVCSIAVYGVVLFSPYLR